MRLRPKAVAAELAARVPVYRFLPQGPVRDYTAVRFHQRAGGAALIAYLNANGLPRQPLSAAMVAARAAFRAGLDEQLGQALEGLADRYPESASVPEFRSDLHAFRGELETALRFAEQARMLEPGSSTAAARVVRLSYDVLPADAADHVMREAVTRFPRSPGVLSVACKGIGTPEQFQLLRDTWKQTADEPGELVRVVRQLANGAMRTGLLEVATDLYREALLLVASGRVRARPVVTPTLAGKGAWAAIADIQRTLDEHGIRFFFAAGTALGLVREGRPLGSDDDIDLGIFAADWDREKLMDVFCHSPLFRPNHHPQTEKIGLEHRGGSRIDIFRFYEKDGRVWHDGVFVRWQNTPFRVEPTRVRDLDLPLPGDPDRYLTENYGDWRTPHSSFDAFTEDAPNVEVIWREYLRVHYYRRAYRKATAGAVADAAQEIEHIGDTDFADQLRKAGERS